MAKRIFTPNQDQWIGDRWEEGYTQAELASFLGVNRDTIRKVLVRLGLRPRYQFDLLPLEDRRAEYLNL